MRMKISLILVFFYVTHVGLVHCQNNNLTGVWEGTLTQEKGGYKSSYPITISLNDDGKEIKGTFSTVTNELSAKIEINGSWINKKHLQLQDGKVIHHKEPKGVEWCTKIYKLQWAKLGDTSTLIGTWSGTINGDSCIPGKLTVKRQKTRA